MNGYLRASRIYFLSLVMVTLTTACSTRPMEGAKQSNKTDQEASWSSNDPDEGAYLPPPAANSPTTPQMPDAGPDQGSAPPPNNPYDEPKSDSSNGPSAVTYCRLEFPSGAGGVSTNLSLQACKEHCARNAAHNPGIAPSCLHVDGQSETVISAKANHHIQRSAALKNAISAFSSIDYLQMYDDVAQAGFDAQEHYKLYGRSEFRSPNILFSESWYVLNNLDVRDAIKAGQFNSGLSHYLEFGRNEGRKVYTQFDEWTYLKENIDVAVSVLIDQELSSGLEHYVLYGRQEGRPLPVSESATAY